MNRFFLACSALSVACAAVDPSDGPGEPAGASCEPVSSTPLDLDDVAPSGFSARAAVDAALGEHTAPMAWAGGADSTLTTVIDGIGQAVFVDYEVPDDGSGIRMEIACVDQLEIPASLVVSTADGALNETRPVTILADGDRASVFMDLSGPVVGTFSLAAFVPDGAAYDDVSAYLSLFWSAEGLSGSLDGQGSGTDGDTAFAEGFDIATIGD